MARKQIDFIGTDSTIALRPYQRETVKALQDAVREGDKSILVVAPTGAGKGTVAAHLMLQAAKQGKSALFVVHRREIVEDVAQRIREHGLTGVGVWVSGSPPGDRTAPVQVACINTLTARGARPKADLIIWDEAHHATASSYRALSKAYPNAIHIGFTATPERADGTPLGDVFGRLIVSTSARELIESGYLVPCETLAPNRHLDGDLAQHPVDVYREYANGRPTIVFAKNIAHGEDIAAAYNEAGISAVMLTGTTPTDVRRKALLNFERGIVKVIVNAYILTEGWDCQSAQVCILARSMGAASTYIQAIGRILRPMDGKHLATIIDLAGNCQEHGLLDDHRIYSLTGTQGVIADKDGQPPLVACPSCGRMMRACPVCKHCGHVFERGDAAPNYLGVGLERQSSYHGGDKHLELARLRDKAKAHGYPAGWADAMYRARFGHWPATHNAA